MSICYMATCDVQFYLCSYDSADIYVYVYIYINENT